MLNPRPAIQAAVIEDGRYCLVVDDFLTEPRRMVERAVARRACFMAAPVNCYPGIEQPMDAQFDQAMAAFFDMHIGPGFGAMRALGLNTRMSIVTLKPEALMPQQRICHRDARECAPGEGAVASVLYLFEDERMGGTSFYRPRRHPLEIDHLLHQARHMDNDAFSSVIGAPPQYYNGDARYFERLGTVPARWNRAIFYDATIFHSGQIDAPALLSADPALGRLTINAFIRYRR
ncbi:DUF6445 family protein [Duganella sp.]|uniref:DUF6445 family protein n=1 Tax=Duganella sp. TaxID=1904440 RepID=UPI0031CF0894